MERKSDRKYLIGLIIILVLGGAAVVTKFYFFSKDNTSKKSTAQKSLLPQTTRRNILNDDPSQNADFSLDSNIYTDKVISVISNFEASELESWQGSGVIEEKIFYEGKSSLSLVSTDRKAASAMLEKVQDFSSMEFIEFMVHIADTETYETITLDFSDSALKNYYRYSLTNLKNGWNLIQIPKDKFILQKAKDATFDWATIEKVRFSTMSRPSSIFLTRIDFLRSINSSGDYLSQWRSSDLQTFFTLALREGKYTLMARNIGVHTGVLKEIEDINDFMFSSSISPQTSGRTGLFIRGNYSNGYGYYFLIGGNRKNNWEIQKRNRSGWTPVEEKIQGVLQNVVFSRDKKYWLRVEAKGDVMTFYFSFDGQKYEKLGEITDNEFRGGGVGITAFDSGAWSFFDDFHFKRY